MRRPSVLYIAGWGRSGSTLLTAVLGQLRGCFAAGELRSLWGRGLVQRRLCSCGAPVPDCPTWAPVVARSAPRAALTPDQMADVQRRRLRTRHYPVAWLRALRRVDPGPVLESYVATYRGVYEALDEVTEGGVIVDSSKYPLDAYYLARAGLDLRVLHLLRDPRAVARSWASPKPLLDGEDAAMLRRFNPAASSTIWSTWNAMIDGLVAGEVGRDRVLRLRYEDFVADPPAAVRRIAAFAGLGTARLEMTAAAVSLGETHLVAGNADRFTTGEVAIRPDGAWRSEVGRGCALLATVPALLGLRRYGYPLLVHSGEARRAGDPVSADCRRR